MVFFVLYPLRYNIDFISDVLSSATKKVIYPISLIELVEIIRRRFKASAHEFFQLTARV